jgi:transketolase
MRNAFADEIRILAEKDARVIMLSADIGNRLFDKFKASCPGRFYNTGVAEANTISMAAGLASCGLRPVCYTITPFITARCYEQIKVDVGYHAMPVIIVGTGSGLSYASLGATHHSLDDLALMRSIPGMVVLAPADPHEVRSSLRLALSLTSPVYIRIGKKGEPSLYTEPPHLEFGQWHLMHPGKKIAFLSCGNMLPVALEARQKLIEQGISPAVWNCTSVKPLDEKALQVIFDENDLVITIEEHGKIGGFGSAVADWMTDQERPLHAKLRRIDAGDAFFKKPGEQDHARKLLGLTAERMIDYANRY